MSDLRGLGPLVKLHCVKLAHFGPVLSRKAETNQPSVTPQKSDEKAQTDNNLQDLDTDPSCLVRVGFRG